LARAGAAWSVKGIDAETLAIARARAGESDLTIGAWIDQAILSYSSPPPPREPGEVPEPARVRTDGSVPGALSATASPQGGLRGQDILDLIDQELGVSRQRLDDALRPMGYALKDLALRLVAAESARKSGTAVPRVRPQLPGPAEADPGPVASPDSPPPPPIQSLAPFISDEEMPVLPPPRGYPRPLVENLHAPISDIEPPPIPSDETVRQSDISAPDPDFALDHPVTREEEHRPIPIPPTGDLTMLDATELPSPPAEAPSAGRHGGARFDASDTLETEPISDVPLGIAAQEPESSDDGGMRFTGVQEACESDPDLAGLEARALSDRKRLRVMRIAAGFVPFLIIAAAGGGYIFADHLGLAPLRDAVRQKTAAHVEQAGRTLTDAYATAAMEIGNLLGENDQPQDNPITADANEPGRPNLPGSAPVEAAAAPPPPASPVPTRELPVPAGTGPISEDPPIGKLGGAASSSTTTLPVPSTVIRPDTRSVADKPKPATKLAALPKAPELKTASIPPSASPEDLSITALRNEARAGDPSAQHELARRLFQGDGVGQNFTEGSEWFREAAIQGVANAQYNLAVLYERGLGVTKDDVRALLWYHSAAEQSHPLAQYNLGIFYLQGRGIPLSYAEAVYWFKAASDQGVAKATYNLAVLTEDGLGVAPSLEKAMALYQQAADAGHHEAADRLALLKGPGGSKTKPAPFEETADTQAEGSTTGTTVADIQAHLRRIGIYDGRIDGIAGPRTRTAIREFQKQHALPITGIPSETLLDFMKNTGAPQPRTG
jgi:TPR repeat protein